MTENVSFMDGTNWTESTWNTYAQMLMARPGVQRDGTSMLAVIQNSPVAMNIIVGTGVAWLKGLRYENTAAKTITVTAADPTYTRIDAVVLRIDWAANTMTAVMHNGTAAASPVAPTLTQTSSVWEYPIAYLTIPAGTAAIETAMIADARTYLYGTEIEFIIEGGGAVISTGSKGYIKIPFACTITGWELFGDQAGSIVIDVKKSSYSAFPTTASITGSALPTLSSVQKNVSSALTGWTTAIAEGDILEFYVNSCTTITRAVLSLAVTRTS